MKILFFIALNLIVHLSIAQDFDISLLKNLNVDGFHTNATPQYFTEYNGVLYFSYVNKSTDNVYYMVKSEGEDSNTNFVYTDKFFNPGGYTLAGAKMFFAAEDSINGHELWITDGTNNGTQLVKDIYPGKKGSEITGIIAFVDIVYFVANDSVHGKELWRSDGTETGTYLVKDIAVGISNSLANNLIIFKDKIYFEASDSADGFELYVSDGTANGTQRLTQTDGGRFTHFLQSEVFVYNQKMYFAAFTSSNGVQLWESDGSNFGTKLFLKLHPNGNSKPQSFILFKNKMCFVANNEKDGFEIWASDGTAQGTTMITDLNPNILINPAENLIVYKNKLYFSLNDGINGWELWSTDITPKSSYFIKDINSGNLSSYPSNSFIYKGYLFFTASSSGKCHVWVTDGNDQFCKSIIPLNVQTNNAVCNRNFDFFQYKNDLFFPANYYTQTGLELYKLTIKPASNLSQFFTRKLEIYPNPVKQTLHFSQTCSFKLYNSSGSLICEEHNVDFLQTVSMAEGLYHLITSDGLCFIVQIQH